MVQGSCDVRVCGVRDHDVRAVELVTDHIRVGLGYAQTRRANVDDRHDLVRVPARPGTRHGTLADERVRCEHVAGWDIWPVDHPTGVDERAAGTGARAAKELVGRVPYVVGLAGQVIIQKNVRQRASRGDYLLGSEGAWREEGSG